MLRMRPSRVIGCPIIRKNNSRRLKTIRRLWQAASDVLSQKHPALDPANFWLILPPSFAGAVRGFLPRPGHLLDRVLHSFIPVQLPLQSLALGPGQLLLFCFAALSQLLIIRCPAGIGVVDFGAMVPQFASGLAVARAPWRFDWRWTFLFAVIRVASVRCRLKCQAHHFGGQIPRVSSYMSSLAAPQLALSCGVVCTSYGLVSDGEERITVKAVILAQ